MKTCSSLNPVTFLPEKEAVDVKRHDCELVSLQSYTAREDLLDTPLIDAYLTLFCDGNSMEHGTRKSGYTVVTLHQTLGRSSLMSRISAQLAEHIALTGALQINRGQKVNIYTDSRYTLLVLHIHTAI